MSETAKQTKSKTRYGTVTKKCSCTGTKATEYQDKIYGIGMRIFNYCKLGKSLRCTCCERIIDL